MRISPIVFTSFKEWEAYGYKNKYDKKRIIHLRESENSIERSWCNQGYINRWLDHFKFEIKKPRKSPFYSFEEWNSFGIQHGFNHLSKTQLKNGNHEQRSWYSRGSRKKWIDKFNCEEGKFVWKRFNKSMWIGYGIAKGYNKQNAEVIAHSRKNEERCWYQKGADEKWVKYFSFKQIKNLFKSFEEWNSFGIKNDYNHLCPSDARENDDRDTRRWCHIGDNNKWTKRFPFKKEKIRLWFNLKEWKKYGLDQGYELRNPSSFIKSQDKKERNWYRTGQKQSWLNNFKFLRLKTLDKKIKNPQQLLNFLEKNPEAKEITTLSDLGYSKEVADILVQLWPERFPSAAQLARSLPEAVKHIGYSLHPFRMDKARGLYEKTRSMPSQIKYSLDNLIYSIAVDGYQKLFNDNPKKAFDELSNFTNERNGLRGLAKRVLNYYLNIYNFEIPGYGKINQQK